MENRKILIVEDNAFSRGAMEKILESYNYDTSSCATAEEAIARLQQESFHILITDFHMPGMDGFELIRNARTSGPQYALNHQKRERCGQASTRDHERRLNSSQASMDGTQS
jgi:CheY-like chemotaxis protein